MYFAINSVRLRAAAIVPARHDPIHERTGQLPNVQRAARELERVREGPAELPDDRSDLSLARELHQEDTLKVVLLPALYRSFLASGAKVAHICRVDD